jgi:hypothetical protein
MFQPGDIVIVQKQVNSNAAEGKPAKLTLWAKGPYQTLTVSNVNGETTINHHHTQES